LHRFEEAIGAGANPARAENELAFDRYVQELLFVVALIFVRHLPRVLTFRIEDKCVVALALDQTLSDAMCRAAPYEAIEVTAVGAPLRRRPVDGVILTQAGNVVYRPLGSTTELPALD
jgi:hypothetical protein